MLKLDKYFFFVFLVISGCAENEQHRYVELENYITFVKEKDCDEKEEANCFKFEVTFPLIKLNSSNLKASKSINQDIKSIVYSILGNDSTTENFKEIGESLLKDYKDFKNEFNSVNYAWKIEIKTKVVLNDSGILSLLISSYSFEGGAHGNSGKIAVSYSLSDGKIISLDELILENKFETLQDRAEKNFRQLKNIPTNVSLVDEGFWFEDGFRLNENYTITPDGILFYYSPYEIAPYAMGETQLLVKFDQIKDILKKNSIVNELVN